MKKVSADKFCEPEDNNFQRRSSINQGGNVKDILELIDNTKRKEATFVSKKEQIDYYSLKESISN